VVAGWLARRCQLHSLDLFLGSFVARLGINLIDPYMLGLLQSGDQTTAWRVWIVMAILWTLVSSVMFTAQVHPRTHATNIKRQQSTPTPPAATTARQAR
jgi:hypothetical protein